MKLKTQKIKSKDYVAVNERVRAFRSHPNFKDMSIETSIIDMSGDRVVMVAKVLDSEGLVRATGHAEEIKGKSGVNATSFIENCETSAVGRCLGFLGIGVDDSIATYEEVEQAIERQEELEKKPNNLPKKSKYDPLPNSSKIGELSGRHLEELNLDELKVVQKFCTTEYWKNAVAAEISIKKGDGIKQADLDWESDG
jgi:hypothetical protein